MTFVSPRTIHDARGVDAVSAISPVVQGPSGWRMSDRVYAELESAIRNLVIKPGQLLSETELAAQLNVSRTPLREALARLAHANLVTVIPQVGTRCARIVMGEVAEASFIRRTLETGAFERAIQDQERDVSRLRALLQRQWKAFESANRDEFFSADESLHEAIFRMAGFPGVWGVVQRSKIQMDRLRRLYLPEAIGTASLIEEHTALVDALERGDAEIGRSVIATHATHVLKRAPELMAAHPEYFSA
jgi:GntR family transcriptional regulator, rspAB operon transcriptional repressor